MTQCCELKDSNSICLNPRQFDFYAHALVERNGLRMDTSIMGSQIGLLNKIVSYKESEIINIRKIITNKDSAIWLYKDSYDKLSIKCKKLNSKNKLLKTTSLTLSAIVLVLGLVIIAK